MTENEAKSGMMFQDVMNRIKEIRQRDKSLIWDARDKFSSEAGYSSWKAFVADNPDCANISISPHDRQVLEFKGEKEGRK